MAGWVEARRTAWRRRRGVARRNPPFGRWWGSTCQAAVLLNKRSATPPPTLPAPLHRAAKDGAGGALVEPDRIAGGGRVLYRHGDDTVDLVAADTEAGQRMRHADLRPQRQHPIEKGAERGFQPDIGAEALDPV